MEKSQNFVAFSEYMNSTKYETNYSDTLQFEIKRLRLQNFPHWTVEGKIFFQSEFNSVDLLKTVIYGLGSMHLNSPLNAQ